jgi:hypothetical protein
MAVEEGIKVKFTGDASGLEQAASKASASLGKFKKGSAEATQSLTNLSRVAQDAPYGFIGIANNINPLLESFQRLKVSTGSTGGAFKALASSMMGAGGLGLAVGVASSLLVVFGDSLFGAGKKSEETAKKVKEVADTIESLAAKTAGASVAGVEKLAIALRDVSLSTDQRKKALEEYNKVAADSNKLQESDLSNIDKINGAIGRQIELLKVRALIKGAEEKLAEQFKKIFEATFLVNKELEKSQPLLKNFTDLFETVGADAKDVRTGLNFSQSLKASTGGFTPLYRATEQAKRSTQGVGAEIQALTLYINQLIKQADGLGGAFDGVDPKKATDKIKTEVNFYDKFLSFDPTKVQVKSKEFAEAWGTFTEFALKNQDIFTGLDAILAEDNKELAIKAATVWWKSYQDALGSLSKGDARKYKLEPIDIAPVDYKNSPAFTKIPEVDIKIRAKPTLIWETTQYAKDQEALAAELKALNDRLSTAIADIAITFGEGIGQAFAGGGLQEAFKGIASVVGSFIQELGKMLIKSAIQVEAFKKSIAALAKANPALAIGLGVGLIAIGAAIKNNIPKFPGFQKGAWSVPGVGHSDSFLAKLTPGEMIIPKLVAQRIRAQHGTGNAVATGGVGNMKLTGTLRAHMREIVASIVVEQQSQRRAFG